MNLTIYSILFCLLLACNPKKAEESVSNNPIGDVRNLKLQLPSGKILKTRVAITPAEHTQGLSGIPADQFAHDEAMLFYYSTPGYRRFWMPDTYFNLDIIFLDKNLRVIDVDRNVPAHPTHKTPPPIATTRTIYSWHVLEIRADSPISAEIAKGVQFKLIGPFSLPQIESKIRSQQYSPNAP